MIRKNTYYSMFGILVISFFFIGGSVNALITDEIAVGELTQNFTEEWSITIADTFGTVRKVVNDEITGNIYIQGLDYGSSLDLWYVAGFNSDGSSLWANNLSQYANAKLNALALHPNGSILYAIMSYPVEQQVSFINNVFLVAFDTTNGSLLNMYTLNNFGEELGYYDNSELLFHPTDPNRLFGCFYSRNDGGTTLKVFEINPNTGILSFEYEILPSETTKYCRGLAYSALQDKLYCAVFYKNASDYSERSKILKLSPPSTSSATILDINIDGNIEYYIEDMTMEDGRLYVAIRKTDSWSAKESDYIYEHFIQILDLDLIEQNLIRLLLLDRDITIEKLIVENIGKSITIAATNDEYFLEPKTDDYYLYPIGIIANYKYNSTNNNLNLLSVIYYGAPGYNTHVADLSLDSDNYYLVGTSSAINGNQVGFLGKIPRFLPADSSDLPTQIPLPGFLDYITSNAAGLGVSAGIGLLIGSLVFRRKH